MSHKKRDIYIIDGYNLMSNWPDVQADANVASLVARTSASCASEVENFADQRGNLVHKLGEYGAYEGYDLIIVFDAPFTEEAEHTEKINAHLSLVFTGSGETADSVIERLTYTLKGKGALYVVTSDAAEQTVVLGAGAYRIPCREFVKRIHRAQKRLKRDYLGTVTLPLSRNEIGAHLDDKVSAELDALRRM